MDRTLIKTYSDTLITLRNSDTQVLRPGTSNVHDYTSPEGRQITESLLPGVITHLRHLMHRDEVLMSDENTMNFAQCAIRISMISFKYENTVVAKNTADQRNKYFVVNTLDSTKHGFDPRSLGIIVAPPKSTHNPSSKYYRFRGSSESLIFRLYVAVEEMWTTFTKTRNKEAFKPELFPISGMWSNASRRDANLILICAACAHYAYDSHAVFKDFNIRVKFVDKKDRLGRYVRRTDGTIVSSANIFRADAVAHIRKLWKSSNPMADESLVPDFVKGKTSWTQRGIHDSLLQIFDKPWRILYNEHMYVIGKDIRDNHAIIRSVAVNALFALYVSQYKLTF